VTYVPSTYTDFKNSVSLATTASITLSGEQTIDGFLTASSRVLVKNQGTSANGLYVSAAGAWVRATDADQNLEITPGMMVTVEQGTVNQDTVWTVTNDTAITIGSTTITFAQISGSGSTDLNPAYRRSWFGVG